MSYIIIYYMCNEISRFSSVSSVVFDWSVIFPMVLTVSIDAWRDRST